MKRNGFSLPGVGISSLIVIFAVLCLTVFALLSVSTVNAQLRLADKSRKTTEGYYMADCRAEAVLSRLRGGQIPEGVTREGNVYTYSCPISETQVLKVCVEIEGENYRILRWQAVSAANWEADDDLPVWGG